MFKTTLSAGFPLSTFFAWANLFHAKIFPAGNKFDFHYRGKCWTQNKMTAIKMGVRIFLLAQHKNSKHLTGWFRERTKKCQLFSTSDVSFLFVCVHNFYFYFQNLLTSLRIFFRPPASLFSGNHRFTLFVVIRHWNDWMTTSKDILCVFTLKGNNEFAISRFP